MKTIYKKNDDVVELTTENWKTETVKKLLDEGYVMDKQIPETVEDEDILAGYYYPASETWND